MSDVTLPGLQSRPLTVVTSLRLLILATLSWEIEMSSEPLEAMKA